MLASLTYRLIDSRGPTRIKSWPARLIKQLASMRNGSAGVRAWICLPTAKLVQQKEALQREFGMFAWIREPA